MGNFDFLLQEDKFDGFSNIAITAEKVFDIDPSTCALVCRRAMEMAVKWMYSVDRDLEKPYQDNLVTLLNTDDFRSIVDQDLWNRLDYIRRVGNLAAHSGPKSLKNVSKKQVLVALEFLQTFFKFIAYSYSQIDVPEEPFDARLVAPAMPNAASVKLQQELDEAKSLLASKENELQEMTAKYNSAQTEATALRQEKAAHFQMPQENTTEAETRKAYIDVMLAEVGWQRGKDWIDEYPIENMPNASGTGSADYVLLSDDGKPLAVVEAKRTSKDVAVGRQQAKLYADDLQRRFGRRPIIFLTNGFDTRILEDQPGGYPERQVSGIYSKTDLEEEFFKLQNKVPLENIVVDDSISNRYYQKEAIKAVCDAFDAHNRRKALLVMATGSGKTRTVISLVDVLQRHGWIKNFLFLADRNSLVTQAKRAFVNLMPNLSVTNLTEADANPLARGIFSTYQTMIGCVDSAKDKNGNKVFTCGHFDLIIVDEAHRSLYNKYKAIFEYFDALLVGLTATPKDEIDRNTYSVFDLENGVPTYNYDLNQAVKDGYLVNYHLIDCQFKFMKKGIKYNELSEEEKREYEKTFADPEGNIPESIDAAALNKWVFNHDTIAEALNILMTMGQRVHFGNDVGKTIIFANSHRHAEKILEIFKKQYPNFSDDYCAVIDNYINYAQSLLDSFSNPEKMPRIAISVDMLDTGVDVPSILNLVFFKNVMSLAKFWQMIGRGTRLCPGLLDGKDKENFSIFDLCSNFDFFSVNPRGMEGQSQITLPQSLFCLEVDLISALQDINLQTDELIAIRKGFVKKVAGSIKKLNRQHFRVAMKLKYVDAFQTEEAFTAITPQDVENLKSQVAPLIAEELDDFDAARFDVLVHQIEGMVLAGKVYGRGISDVTRRLTALSKLATIPDIQRKIPFIQTLLHTDYMEKAGMEDWEKIRLELRDLMKYIPRTPKTIYETDFKDTLEQVKEPTEQPVEPPTEPNYQKKVEFYLKEHENIPAVRKLRTNQPLTKLDMDDLEDLLWHKLGTKEQYVNQYQNKPLGEFVRSIVGMDQAAVQKEFSHYINEANLNAHQIDFVKRIIDYFTMNGMLTDMSIFMQPPFDDFVETFGDSLDVWTQIETTIQGINKNAQYLQ